jgi:hypothetical protein
VCVYANSTIAILLTILLRTLHTRKKSAIPPADVDFGMWKTVIIRIYLPQKWNEIFIPNSLWNFCQTKNSSQNQCSYISVLELFHIKFMFISFSQYCNHFTSLAYEILIYARKVDLLDKIKEVVFSQLFPCVYSNILDAN